MRFPLDILSQYIGRKKATLVEMGLIAVAMLFGFFFVKSFNDLLAMGVLLGIAGASFGVALSLGAGSFPAKNKGLAMGLVGAGNVGTAVSVLIAPPLAQAFGWISDRWGGINTLSVVLVTIAVTLVLCGLSGGSLVGTTLLVMLCFSALGAGNGAVFQLVPSAMGLSKQYWGSYAWGFIGFAALAVVMLGMLRVMQLRWTRTWAEKGGRARTA